MSTDNWKERTELLVGAEGIKKLNDAHQQMLSWAQDPQFTSRKTLIDCWSYDGSTNRWSPPL